MDGYVAGELLAPYTPPVMPLSYFLGYRLKGSEAGVLFAPGIVQGGVRSMDSDPGLPSY